MRVGSVWDNSPKFTEDLNLAVSAMRKYRTYSSANVIRVNLYAENPALEICKQLYHHRSGRVWDETSSHAHM